MLIHGCCSRLRCLLTGHQQNTHSCKPTAPITLYLKIMLQAWHDLQYDLSCYVGGGVDLQQPVSGSGLWHHDSWCQWHCIPVTHCLLGCSCLRVDSCSKQISPQLHSFDRCILLKASLPKTCLASHPHSQSYPSTICRVRLLLVCRAGYGQLTATVEGDAAFPRGLNRSLRKGNHGSAC